VYINQLKQIGATASIDSHTFIFFSGGSETRISHVKADVLDPELLNSDSVLVMDLTALEHVSHMGLFPIYILHPSYACLCKKRERAKARGQFT